MIHIAAYSFRNFAGTPSRVRQVGDAQPYKTLLATYMKKIDQQMLDQLCWEAKQAPRLRKNLNFHTEAADTLQRMLNALQPQTYIRPHKHQAPDKREAFVVLQGKLLVVTFTEEGKVSQGFLLDREAGNFGAEVPAGTYHTLIALQENTVIYELKDGPYDPADDKYFAPWAPEEGSTGAQAYNQKLLRELKML